LYIEKNLLLRYLVKGFSVQKKWEKNNFVNSDDFAFCIMHFAFIIRADKSVNYKTKRSFNLQPKKTIICEAQAIKAEIPKRELILK